MKGESAIKPQPATLSFEDNRGNNGRFPSHPLRLGMATAWLAIFLLWGSWLLAAWVYVRAILTNLPVAYHWDPFIANGMSRAAADLGVSPALFAWVYLASASTLVATFGTAGVILFRHKQDGFGAFLGVSLVLIGTYIASPVATVLSVPWPVLQRPLGYLGGLAFIAFGALLYLFPDGRFIPRWTRWLPPFIFLQMVVTYETEMPQLLSTISSLIYLSFGLGVQVYRYRRLSDAMARRHIRWIIIMPFAAFTLIVVLQALFAPNLTAKTAPLSPRDLLAAILSITAITPASIGFVIALSVAILRDGLYNLDIFINRALVYGGLTAVILLIYALIVGGLSLLFQSPNNLPLSLLATGLIAVLFQPVRERLQRGANRLVYGDRDDPYKVLSRLGRQLGETAVPHQALPAITATLCQTLKLPYAAIQLADNDQRQLVASSGEPGTAVLQEWPLCYQNELVGWLQAAPRSPSEPFTLKEQQLLGDIAAQAGVVAYSLRLTNALQQSREKLVLAREEERRRIRRDLHDGLGPALASQTFALDTALDLLESDPHRAAQLIQLLKTQNQATVADIRRLVYALRPPALDELGLVGALQAHVGQMEQGGLEVVLTAVPTPLPPLSAAVEVAAYRITLEAITNAVRHARARHCRVILTIHPSYLHIVITDDGRGLPPNAITGVGLRSMRERAEELGGSLQVVNGAEGGVSITAVLPLAQTGHTASML